MNAAIPPATTPAWRNQNPRFTSQKGHSVPILPAQAGLCAGTLNRNVHHSRANARVRPKDKDSRVLCTAAQTLTHTEQLFTLVSIEGENVISTILSEQSIYLQVS